MSKINKLAIIGTLGLPARYGGFESLVEELVKYLNQDFEITVYCSGVFYPKEERQESYNGAKLKYIPLKANGFQSIPYDIYSIFHAAFKADILLILGVSGCLVLPLVKFFSKKRVFVNIDGIEWKRDKWGRFIKTFLRYSEIMAVEVSENVITDNEVIRQYLKATYNYNSNLIEYGGDQATHIPPSTTFLEKYPFLGEDYLFGVCRIEPENNIHIVLDAVTKQSKYPFVMVGNWENSEYGSKLKSKFHNGSSIILLDPIYESIELNTLRSNCYLYIHGHSAGGTNPSLVEAMNLTLPIICFDVGYNRETTEDKALYFKTSNRLLDIIENFNEDQKNDLSEKMFSIAKRRYTWKIIANKYKKMMLKDTFDMKG